MSKKVLITLPDDVITAIEEYNKEHSFAPIVISNFCTAKLREFFKLEPATSQPQAQEDKPEVNTPTPKEKPAKTPRTEESGQKVCEYCGGSMEGRSTQALYCSDECSNKAKVAKRNLKRAEERAAKGK